MYFCKFFADGKLPKLLIDGCFFNEMPSDVDGKQVGVIILSDQDGNKIMAIKGVKLSDESKRYAVKRKMCQTPTTGLSRRR